MKCRRCEGTGIVIYQHGKPGTDRHAPYSEVEWGPKVEKECPVCLGTGYGKRARKQRPERGMVALHADEETLQRAIESLPLGGKDEENGMA